VNVFPISVDTGLGPPFPPDQVTYAGPAPFEVAGISQINFEITAAMTGAYATIVSVTLPNGQPISNGFYLYVTQ